MDETAMEILFDGKHGLSLKQGLNRLYKDKTLCDVTLTSSDGIDIQAHWLVLAAHSDFLRHLAVSRNVKQSMVSDTGCLKLNIESEILKMMLDYLYTGELVVTKDNLHKIKLAAKVLQLSKALALLERSHLSGLGDQSCEAESKILQPTASLQHVQAPVLEQQQLKSPGDQEFAVVGTLTQSPASYCQAQSKQSPVPLVQVQSPMFYAQGYLQSPHYDSGFQNMQQPAALLQPTILSVESICDRQTAFSSPSLSNAYLNQRPSTKDSSHEHSSVSHGKGGVVCTHLEGPQQNVSTEVSMTNNLDDGSTSQSVHSLDDATSHNTQVAFSEPSCVHPEHESGEPGRRRSEPTRQFLDKGQIVAGRRPGAFMNSLSLVRPVGKQQTDIQRKRGRPATVFTEFSLDTPIFQRSSAKYVKLNTRKTDKQLNQNKSSGSFAVSTYRSEERSLNEQEEGEASHLSAEAAAEDMTAQVKSPYSNTTSTQDSVEVDLGLVKTEPFDSESDGMDYVILENPDSSDTDSCGQSLSHCDQDKARNCRARKVVTSKFQRRSSHGSMSYFRLRSVLRSKYLLSQYVQKMCIWKTEMSPFRCRVCKRRFKHLSSLKLHCLSTHLSKVRRLKRNPQAEPLSPTTPSSQASMMEYNSVRTQHRTGISRTKGPSLTLRAKGKSLTRRTSQTPGSEGKAQLTRKSKPLKLVLPTTTEDSGQEGQWKMSSRISTQQDHTANISLLQEGEDRQNVVLDNSIPPTTADSTRSEKQHYMQENSRTKGPYNSSRYPCSSCGKPFHFKSNMLRHFNSCSKPKVKDKEKRHRKDISGPKKIASSSKVVDGKKVSNGRANNFHLIKKYLNGTTCILCNKTFSRADTTRMHIRAVHFKQKLYTCVCKEEFGWSTLLSAHKKTCQLIAQQKGNIFSS